jgi:putative hydrolase of HD superfamily
MYQSQLEFMPSVNRTAMIIFMSIEFYAEVGRLKRLPRTGWIKRGIPNPETVAEHMYRSQFIAYDFAKRLGEDPIFCAHMMMIHDLPEARSGDITPDCGISKAEKAELEMKAAQELAALSGNPEFFTIFQEYEENKSLRAQLCKDADQIECIVQALEYGAAYPEKREALENFWPYTYAKLQTAVAFEMFDELFARKRNLWQSPDDTKVFQLACH